MIEPVQGRSQAIKYRIVPFTRGRGLDLACGEIKTFPHFIGLDNYMDWKGRINHPELPAVNQFNLRMSVDVIGDAFDLSMFSGASMDFVLASHILHLAKSPKDALREWWRLIKPGGFLILYGPSEENIAKHIVEYMQSNAGSWDLVEYEDAEKEKTFFQVFKKI